MLIANLFCSKVSYKSVKQPCVPSPFKKSSGFFMQFSSSSYFVQHDLGTLYSVSFVGKTVL